MPTLRTSCVPSRSARTALVTLVALCGLLASTSLGHAAPLTRSQSACVLGLERAGRQVARVRISRFVRCVDAVARGDLPAGQSAAQCLLADPDGRLMRARAKTVQVASRWCADPPPLGPSSPGTVNSGFADILRTDALLGSNLENALTAFATDLYLGRCQQAAARAAATLARARLTNFGSCARELLRPDANPTPEELRACLDTDDDGRLARATRAAEDGVARACRLVDLDAAFHAGCRGSTVGEIVACTAADVQCGACLALDRAANLGADCAATTGLPPGSVCRRPSENSHSVARQWNEALLAAIRIDFPRPPVHARNLFHLSVAMWDAWAAYDGVAAQHTHHERRTSVDVASDRAESISFAAYRLIRHRFAASPNATATRQALDALMVELGYDSSFASTSGDSAAALGNRIAASVIAAGLADGANESINYADPTYAPINDPLVVKLPGTSMIDPNRWQPLALDVQIGQNGIPIPGKIQVYVGPQWGSVTPFALTRANPTDPYLDPGPPPYLGGAGDALFKARILDMLRKTRELTIDDGATIDISPASWGNNPLGTNDGHGYAVNPVTGLPYTPQTIKRGDFTRVLAEFWADGPTSETPPGHWNSLANFVSDHPLLERRLGGTGPVLDPLEWDVKLYLALNGGLHDAAVQCWGLKRYYDYVRPISMIRYMGGLGQSSNPLAPSYHPLGLPLEDGLVEQVTAESSAPGERHAALADHVGEIAVLSWPGQPANPATQYSGVRWLRAVDWVPYQRNTFVTPPFAAYSSGHSTYSRTAAEILTRFTGSSYFPGGLGEYVVPANGLLQFEIGPSTEIRLQWAQYFDAADQAGVSRLYGGIHVATDDFAGRIAGAQIGPLAFDKAVTYFVGSAP